MLVEGHSELEFVRGGLEPHLGQRRIAVFAQAVETSRDACGRKARGGGNWGRWLRDFKRLTGQQRGNETRFTTLFDLYGLPSDFPELAQHSGDRDTTRRAASLEQAMFRAVDDWRLIPYLQRHELETLVLAGFDELRSLLVEEDDVAGYERLRRELAGLLPEDVNDGRDSAPSKRLEGLIPSYRKADHGVRVAKKIGIDRLKQACPRFCDWLAKLEQLGGLGEPSPRP